MFTPGYPRILYLGEFSCVTRGVVVGSGGVVKGFASLRVKDRPSFSSTGSIVRYPNASYQYDKVLGPDATSVIDAPKERFRLFGG